MTSERPMLVVLLLDESGSMNAVREDVIGGYNAYVDKLREDRVERCALSLVTFDSNGIRTRFAQRALDAVPALTAADYRPGALTPLLDAIGRTVTGIDDGGLAVVFVVYTDGLENASCEYTREAVRRLLEEREKQGWTLVYLGAHPEAFAEADSIGIAMNVHAVEAGDVRATMDRFAVSTSAYSRGKRGQSRRFYRDRD